LATTQVYLDHLAPGEAAASVASIVW
jgi:hypothetical protein